MDTSDERASPRHETNLQIINGLPFSLIFKKDIIEEVLKFKSLKDDIILATYPKTGTTWVQYIVLQILSKGAFFPQFNDVLEKYSPFIEMTGTSAVEAIETRPRFYKTHLPYNMLNIDPDSKIIYVYRKPEDNFVSFFYFMESVIGNLDFDQYFEDYISGLVTHGSYFEHILSYLKQIGVRNLLMVSYEKLHAQTKEEILRIAKFLGEDFYREIMSDESILNKIVEHTSFSYMKKNLMLRRREHPIKDKFLKDAPQKNIVFFRKGTVGEGKNTLKDDQLIRLKTLAKEKLKNTNIIQEWYKN